jgi:hypothetical protein
VLSVVQTRALTHPGAERSRTPVATDQLDLPPDAPIWGVAAEYDEAESMIHAATALHGRGLGRLDLYSPVPLPGVTAALQLKDRWIHPVALAAVLLGGAAMMGMCLYATGYDYVFNIGGRPRFSWPAFVVPTVSFATLTGALAAALTMLYENRLPRLNHPAFNIPGIVGATRDRFFLVVEKQGDEFDIDAVEHAINVLPERPLVMHRVPR